MAEKQITEYERLKMNKKIHDMGVEFYTKLYENRNNLSSLKEPKIPVGAGRNFKRLSKLKSKV